MKSPALFAISLIAFSGAALAGECEDNFSKSGNAFTGSQYNSRVTVDNLSMKDAMGQMRGLAIAEKLDVITEDFEGGSMLVEQRSSTFKRPVPAVLNFNTEGKATTVDMTIKPEKGVFAKQDDMKVYICRLLSQVKSGKEGKAAAAKGMAAQNKAGDTVMDVGMFSRDIAREAKANSVAVNARHKGRSYTLKGKISQVFEDGAEYNVAFETPDPTDSGYISFPGEAMYRVYVSCLFKENQLANVLTFRQGQRVTFTGTFLRYDSIKNALWLQNCKPTVKK
jgi:hypothetical protein